MSPESNLNQFEAKPTAFGSHMLSLFGIIEKLSAKKEYLLVPFYKTWQPCGALQSNTLN